MLKVNLIERVNGIFTRVDWGLDMNNRRLMGLGFAIKEIKIYDKPTASPITHFNAGTGQHVSAFDMLRVCWTHRRFVIARFSHFPSKKALGPSACRF